MALALLWPAEEGDDGFGLRFDIGHNRYYGWQLGEGEVTDHGGVRCLAEPTQRSPLLGPLSEAALGRGVIEVPRRLVTREHRFVQLASFRDRERRGPALSEIVELPAPGGGPGGAPDLAFSRRLPYRGVHAMTLPAPAPAGNGLPVGNTPFRYRVHAPSNGMDLGDALLSVLPAVAPAIGSLVGSIVPGLGSLLGGLAAGSGSAGPGAGGPLQQLITPETLRVLMDAVKGPRPPASPSVPAAPMRSEAQGSLGRRVRANRPVRAGRPGGYVLASSSPYSEAMFAPALLAALPVLQPLLQQVLTPQTIQGVIDAPQKATGQILNGVLDLARLGLQGQQQVQDYLRQLNPGVDDPTLNQLLLSMSLGGGGRQRLSYRRVPSVRLDFGPAASQVLFGRTRVLYRKGRPFRFPLTLTTPKPIGEASLVLQVKDAHTLRVLAEHSEPTGALAGGPLPVMPEISSEKQESLTAGRDYIAVATLLWKTQKGSAVGTSMQQRITIMGDYAFDRVEEAGEPIALADFDRDRDYWHQIWEGDLGDGSHRVDLRARYYFILRPDRDRNSRIDSRLSTRRENGVLRGTVEAGLELSPRALNHLLPRLAPDEEPVADAELEALASADFAERLNQVAERSCQIRGRRGERAAIWVYPEFKVQTLVLVQAHEVDEHGNVTRLAEKRVRFPVPVLVHFVGVKSA